MYGLRETQQRFGAHVLQHDDPEFAAEVRANGLTGARRLQVYRNNVFTTLTDTLAAVYPVIVRLVGDGFFRRAARDYIAAHPSRNGDLNLFGERFAPFIEGYTAVAHLPYLADVARLEWAYHEVFNEADSAPLDMTALAAVPAERYPQIVFRLRSATRLVQSAYPLLDIWRLAQHTASEHTVDLGTGGDQLLVFRPGIEVEFQRLDEDEHAFLTAVAACRPLGVICDDLLARYPQFDLNQTIAGQVQLGNFAGFALA